MPRNRTDSLNPRKRPQQRRSRVTIDTIFEATIQVLLANGLDKITTIQIADRAGVSIGSLYQYFPNKRALMFPVRASPSIQSYIPDSIGNLVNKFCGPTLLRILAVAVGVPIGAWLGQRYLAGFADRVGSSSGIVVPTLAACAAILLVTAIAALRHVRQALTLQPVEALR